MKTKYWKKTILFLAAVCLSGSLLAGCQRSEKCGQLRRQKTVKKTFVFGDTL